MADIEIVCTQCGKRFSVYEFTDSAVVCAHCGATVPPPERKPAERNGAPRLRLAHRPTPEAVPVTVVHTPRRARRLWPRRRSAHSGWRGWVPWVLFVVLAAVLAYLRFRAGLSPEAVTLVRRVGVGALLFLHVVIVIHTFGEDTLQGVLCLVIPGYTLFYLFVVSDAFRLRAIVAALLLAFGYDTYHTLRYAADRTKIAVTHWMRTTGTVAQERIVPK